mmetsp:Transcript_1096/g.3393  ORF Transcript_1096/g.3393 Transcript_1096/m.3393 type:complete len:100 (-) Transcript_1096:55-354(-)
MGVIHTPPRSAVTDAAPNFSQTVGNFSLKEWSMPGLLGAIGYPVGAFASGNPSPAFARLGGNVARPTALMAASLGAAAGFLLSYQSSWARLTGYSNDDA